MDRHLQLEWVAGRAWKATARGHAVVADSPVDAGGNDQGMTPGELLVSAVATCMLMDLSYYAERHPGLDLAQVQVHLTWEDAPEKPSRIGRITGAVTLPAGVGDAERAAISRVLSSCKIRRSVEHSVEVAIQVLFE